MAKNRRLLSRSIVTPLVTASFAVVAFTGVLMLLGVRSGPIKGFHELISVLFVISAALHLVVNWGCFLSYVKKPVTIALGATVAVMLVFLVASLGAGGRPAGGRPPLEALRRLEAAPLAAVAPVLGLEAEAAAELLRRGGVSISHPGVTIADIAAGSGRRPPEILDLLTGADTARAPR